MPTRFNQPVLPATHIEAKPPVTQPDPAPLPALQPVNTTPLISTDAGNGLGKGSDGRLFVSAEGSDPGDITLIFDNRLL